MARRDSRGSRRRLLLFMVSMMLGVAALVAIHGFGVSLRQAVDDQSKELLGADLALERSKPFDGEAAAFVDSLGGRRSHRVSFSSMVYFPQGGGTRLVRVRAQRGAYPFYGALGTQPPQAAHQFREGEGRALVDATLMSQFHQSPGDSVRIGRRTYEIAGALEEMPQESGVVSLVSPRVYLPMSELDTTLLAQGSRAEYEVFFQFDADRDPALVEEQMAPRLEELDIRATTAAEAASRWGEGLSNMYRFLSLAAFMALLLGGIGVASAVHVYVRQRLDSIAVLRCLGASSGRTLSIYVAQAAAMGLACAVFGIAAGLGVQHLLPRVLADFLPVAVPFQIAWTAVALGALIGVGGTLLFALIPLVGVRHVSPLRSLRIEYEEDRTGPDLVRGAIVCVLFALVTGAAILQAPSWMVGLGYVGAMAAVFGVLVLTARAAQVLTRRFLPSSWPYTLRQGLANLFRPQNQTAMLTLVLGFGTFLLLTLYLVQATLLSQIAVSGGEQQPNLIFFDVQRDQLDAVSAAVHERGVPVLAEVPIVFMRLREVKGRSVDDIRADSTADYTWAHRRDYRSTYRDSLTASELVVEGTFEREAYTGDGPVPVSVEEGIAEDLGVTLGDTLVFDVQGRLITTVVGSLRDVDWQRMSTNFFVVFPTGVLEDAPQTYAVLTRTGAPEESAALQSAVVDRFPAVSAIDLGLVLNVVESLTDRLAFVLRFMALFSIVTGLVVLAGAVSVSRFQRLEESVLLKAMGASRRQVMEVNLTEYICLGLLAAVAGVALSIAAAWGLSRFVFEAPLVVSWGAIAGGIGIVVGLTVVIGFISSRDIYNRTPLDVLRMEAG